MVLWIFQQILELKGKTGIFNVHKGQHELTWQVETRYFRHFRSQHTQVVGVKSLHVVIQAVDLSLGRVQVVVVTRWTCHREVLHLGGGHKVHKSGRVASAQTSFHICFFPVANWHKEKFIFAFWKNARASNEEFCFSVIDESTALSGPGKPVYSLLCQTVKSWTSKIPRGKSSEQLRNDSPYHGAAGTARTLVPTCDAQCRPWCGRSRRLVSSPVCPSNHWTTPS